MREHHFTFAADDGAKIAKTYDATMMLKPDLASRTSYVIAPDGSRKRCNQVGTQSSNPRKSGSMCSVAWRPTAMASSAR